MARSFTSTSDYLSAASPPNPGGAGSIFVRIKPNWSSGDGVTHYFYEYVNSGAVTFLSFVKFSDNNIYAGWFISGSTSARVVIADTGLFSSGVWDDWLLTWDDVADQNFLYRNGTQVGSDATAFTAQTGFPDYYMGRTNTGNTANAELAEYGKWNYVLSAGERGALFATGSPLNLPNGLEHYYSLIGRNSPETDYRGNYDLTVTGSPSAAPHPRVFYPASPYAFGPAPTLTNYSLTADAGSFALSGQAAALKADRRLTGNAGSFALSGQTAGLLYGRKVAAASGVFTFTGQDVAFRLGYGLTAAAGSFALTGQTATLTRTRHLVSDAGSFALSGQAATLKTARLLTAANGSFALNGQAAELRRGFGMVASAGSFAFTGQAAQLMATRLLTAASGTFTLTGQPAGLETAGDVVPISRDRRILKPYIQ